MDPSQIKACFGLEPYYIKLQNDYLFNDLSNIKFEEITNGRKAVNLVEKINNSFSVVRTTSKYENKSILFKQIHYNIINDIKQNVNFDINFNNALMELYNVNYKTMRFHSDCGLDLKDSSFICIYSNYSNKNYNRTLKIKHKIKGFNVSIELEHNSCVIFSTDYFNKYYKHKIMYNNKSQDDWLGITFRLSKSFITFRNSKTFLNNKELIKMDTGCDFYKYKSSENKSPSFNYPEINYSTSPGDFINPI